MTRFQVIAYMILASGCSVVEQQSISPADFYKSSFFHDVQINAVFPDSKTFVDCTPKRDLKEIVTEYEEIRNKPDFDLREFVNLNFDLPVRPKSSFAADTTLLMEEHL